MLSGVGSALCIVVIGLLGNSVDTAVIGVGDLVSTLVGSSSNSNLDGGYKLHLHTSFLIQ